MPSPFRSLLLFAFSLRPAVGMFTIAVLIVLRSCMTNIKEPRPARPESRLVREQSGSLIYRRVKISTRLRRLRPRAPSSPKTHWSALNLASDIGFLRAAHDKILNAVALRQPPEQRKRHQKPLEINYAPIAAIAGTRYTAV
ncbi:hypothetical protein EVAR_119_1 [Eumeta japonica]|uniref:Uncharacterized protein n=1 Tax=Eumeta variegata TaxID=151549 RepID=A0A4C1S8I3_EUMVA|nr:hypothetical protein EVAR_119_1 [Eumeta japonica]